MALRWLDTAWSVLASRWAVAIVLGGWALLLLVCSWVPQAGPPSVAEGTAVARWLAAVEADRPAVGELLDRLGLVRAWGGWVVRALQGFTAGWLALLGAGEMLGWLAPASRQSTVGSMDAPWDDAQREAVDVAHVEGWQLLRADEETVVMRARTLDAWWRRALVRGLWVALLLVAAAWWLGQTAPYQHLTIPLALGSEAHVERWGIASVQLKRLQFRTGPDGTPRDLAADLAFLLTDGTMQRMRLIPGRVTSLRDTAVRAVGIGPVLRLTARSLTGQAATLSSMSGTEAEAEVLRVRLGGVNQEHLVALDQGKATLRLVEGATGLPSPWAVLGELLDGYTGRSLGREPIQPPDTVSLGNYVATFAPEYYLEVQLAPRVQGIGRVAAAIGVIALGVALVSLAARWRWRPESAVVVLSPADTGSRCVCLASASWGPELVERLGCQSGEGGD